MAKFQFEFDSVTKEGKFTRDGQDEVAESVSFGSYMDYDTGKKIWYMNSRSRETDKENGIYTEICTVANQFAAAALGRESNDENIPE